jgi:hypothetical protein
MIERYGGMDFGLTGLIGAYFHQDWRHGGTDVEVVTSYATQNPRMYVEAVLLDAARLDDSTLPTPVVETLWSVATVRCHDLKRQGWDGRAWLQKIIQLCQGRLVGEDPSYDLTVPPSPYMHLAEVVVDEIARVTPRLHGWISRDEPGLGEEVGEGLRGVATEACPDLAFRLLLRELSAFGSRISQTEYDRYMALGEQFGYGELLIEGYAHLIEEQPPVESDYVQED